MRRFILGWKVLGYARRFKADIVNYADDIAVLGRAPAAEMLAAVEGLMKRLKLPLNAEKTRCCRVPEETDDVARLPDWPQLAPGTRGKPTSAPARARRASRAFAVA